MKKEEKRRKKNKQPRIYISGFMKVQTVRGIFTLFVFIYAKTIKSLRSDFKSY